MSIGLPEEESPFDSPSTDSHGAILIVDEDPAFQLGLKTFLREYVGFDEVFTANSGQKALDLLEVEPSIDVVTLDYQMPGMNGIEVLREIQERISRPISVTMITGYPSEELESEFRAFESPTLLTSHFLAKPVEFEKLEPLMLRSQEDVAAIRRKIRKKRAESMEKEDETEDLELDPGPLDEIEQQLAQHGAKLEEIETQVRQLRGRWRSDFWALVAIGGLAWASIHFGWWKPLAPTWEKVQAQVASWIESVSTAQSPPQADPSSNEATEPEAVPEESAPAATGDSPAPIETAPANSGQPL